MQNSNSSHSRLMASLMTYSILTCTLFILVGTVLYALGKLPLPTKEFIDTAGIILGVIFLIIIIGMVFQYLLAFVSHLFNLLEPTNRTLRTTYAFATILVVLSLFFVSLFQLESGYIPPARMVIPDHVRTVIPTVTPLVTPSNPMTKQWRPYFTQQTPFCDNPKGTNWKTPRAGISLSCTRIGLEMQQTASSLSDYGEIDLDQVNRFVSIHQPFREQVQILPQYSDGYGRAGLLVQESHISGKSSGYIFMIDGYGDWRLMFINDSQNFLASVQEGFIHLPDTPNNIVMSIVIENKTLYGFVNGKLVLSQADNIVASLSTVGLIVSSDVPLDFSNFELDQPLH